MAGRAVRATERAEAALEREDGDKRDQLATIKKLLALAVHPNTPAEEAASANSKAEALLRDYAEAAATGVNSVALSTCNSNWDKASEHAAKAAPYIHPKPAPQQPGVRPISELSNEELEAAAAEARAELAAIRASLNGSGNGSVH